METLGEFDREQRRAKPRRRRRWADALIRPQTVKALIRLAPLLAKLVQLAIELVRVFRH